MSFIEYFDGSHFLNGAKKIPVWLIAEIIVIIFMINLIFATIYYQLYKSNNDCFTPFNI
jgi:hypothetical protein